MLVTPANPGNGLQDCCSPEIHSSAVVRKGFKPAVLKFYFAGLLTEVK
jgi:hypothetical protein